MATLGSIPANTDLPYLETTEAFPTAVAIAVSTFTDIDLTPFTMPWIGSLMIDVTVCAQWAGRQQIALSNAPATTPAVSTMLGYTVIAGSPNCFATCPAVYSWTTLAKSQVVTPHLRVACGGGPGALQIDSMRINYRAWMA